MELNKHFDYTDSYSETVHTTRPISAEELTGRFFCASQWIIALMKLRNAIVKPFGLKGENNLSDLVKIESENRATLSKIDKHLDFDVTLMTENIENGNQRISVSTKVRLHNGMGKFYFAIIKPFHRLICKALLKRVRKDLESQ
jgi:hypothetical protein